ncbi:MAG: hypothetical protein SGI92_16295 [Bryobacteraceae bacterium]|nr:hypothetical protein [Bryobacteraceae bacterium]
MMVFTVPEAVPFGCQAPLQITAGGRPANTMVLAITADGSACQN